MSQKAVLVRINGNLVQEVYSSVPDYEEMVEICRDEGYGDFDNDSVLYDYCTVNMNG